MYTIPAGISLDVDCAVRFCIDTPHIYNSQLSPFSKRIFRNLSVRQAAVPRRPHLKSIHHIARPPHRVHIQYIYSVYRQVIYQKKSWFIHAININVSGDFSTVIKHYQIDLRQSAWISAIIIYVTDKQLLAGTYIPPVEYNMMIYIK